MKAIETKVTLEQVQIHSIEVIEAAAMTMFTRADVMRTSDRDEIVVRRMIRGWGRLARAELRCPATWWQHLKLALRRRWPRLFWRLTVRYEHATAENGAIVAGLQPVADHHLVIPIVMPTFEREYTDDPSKDDDLWPSR